MAVIRAAALVALVACTDDVQVVSPVIDVPIDDVDAIASQLDEISLSVAHAGNDRALVEQTFAHGKELALPGVPYADDLVIHMTGFVGPSATSYGRSCAFPVTGGGSPPEPHVYFSNTTKFGNLAFSTLPRVGGLGVPYLGAALLIGGNDGSADGSNPTQDVELFDPASATLTKLDRVEARTGAVSALLGVAPSRVAVLGGIARGAGSGVVEVLDGRQVNRFELAETARTLLTATSSIDGRVIAIGGFDPATGKTSGAIDELDDETGTLEVRKLQVGLSVPRRGHTATRLGDDVGAPVLIAGGLDGLNKPIALAELYKPLSRELVDPAVFKPMMHNPRSGHIAALMPDGSVLFIGGVDESGLPAVNLERFSLDSGFETVAVLPAGAGVLDFQATTLPDGRVLLTGGRLTPSSPPMDTAYIVRLDRNDGTVDVFQTDHMHVPRAGHQATLLCDGTVLITGGIGAGFPAERYNPPADGRR